MSNKLVKITLETIIKKYNLFSFNIPIIEKNDYKKFHNALLEFYLSYLMNKIGKNNKVVVNEYSIEKKDYGILIKTSEFEDVIYF